MSQPYNKSHPKTIQPKSSFFHHDSFIFIELLVCPVNESKIVPEWNYQYVVSHEIDVCSWLLLIQGLDGST